MVEANIQSRTNETTIDKYVAECTARMTGESNLPTASIIYIVWNEPVEYLGVAIYSHAHI
jgi:hypothetical protein